MNQYLILFFWGCFIAQVPFCQACDMKKGDICSVAPPSSFEPATIDLSQPNQKPIYPNMSKRLGEQGTVVLRVMVKADGNAGKVEVKSSSSYPRLDQAAIDAVKTWRFNPPKVDGKAIDGWYVIPFPFKLVVKLEESNLTNYNRDD